MLGHSDSLGQGDRRPNGSASGHRDPVLEHDGALVEAASLLQPLSHSLPQLIVLTSDERSTLDDLVNVIVHDQVLAAALLREANSAASGAMRTVTTVDQAMIRLGSSRVLALAVRMAISKQLAGAVPEYGLADGDLAALSVTGSIAAEVVRERAKAPLPMELPTAALLRDIGMLVLARFLDPPHQLLLHVAREAGAPLVDGERMVLDANHGEVGAVLCQSWRFSELTRLGVQYHHHPEACGLPVAYGVFLADTVAHIIAVRAGARWSHSTPVDDAVTEAMGELGIRANKLEELVEETVRRFKDRRTGLAL